MAANMLLALLGALSIAGIGIGAATVSNIPYAGMPYGGCPGQGGGVLGYGNGKCSPSNPNCYTNGIMNATCDPDRDGTCDLAGGATYCYGANGQNGQAPPCH